MDLFDLLVEPRRSLGVLSGVVAVAAAVFVWLNAEPGRAAGATVLFVLAAATAVPAVRRGGGSGWLWLLVSVGTLAAGIWLGYAA